MKPKLIFFLLFLVISSPVHAEMNDSTLQKKAKAGDLQAQMKMAYNYKNDRGGVSRNDDKAFKWAYKAAHNKACPSFKVDCFDAYNFLGSQYARGEGTKQDYVQAAIWYERGAYIGCQPCKSGLAKMFAAGQGVQQDYPSAYYWFYRAYGNVSFSDKDMQILREDLKRRLSPEVIVALEKKAQEEEGKIEQQRLAEANEFFANLKTDPNVLLGNEMNKPSISIETIKSLIKNGANANLALMEAAKEGRIDIMQALLDAGADINWTNENGSTALHSAIAYRQHESALFLIKQGADINIRNATAETPILTAARSGNAKVMSALIKKGANIEDMYGKYPETPLMKAADAGNTEVVKVLLEAGAKTIYELQGPLEATKMDVLEVAVRKGHIETVQAIQSYQNKITN